MINWNSISRGLWGVLIVIVLIGVTNAFLPKYKELRLVQAEKAEAEELECLDKELLQALKEKQDRFARDSQFVQQIAHDMGMARPGEVLFKFKKDEAEPLLKPH